MLNDCSELRGFVEIYTGLNPAPSGRENPIAQCRSSMRSILGGIFTPGIGPLLRILDQSLWVRRRHELDVRTYVQITKQLMRRDAQELELKRYLIGTWKGRRRGEANSSLTILLK